MEQPKPFPQIPKDPKSLVLLQTLDVLSITLMDSQNSKRQRDLGAVLHMLAHAPHEFDYLYFCAHQGTRDIDNEYREWYNRELHSKGDKHKLKVLNREIGDLQNHFNAFQLAFYNINEHSKTHEEWTPLNNLLWCVFCSMFDKRKFERLMDRIREIIAGVRDESIASMN